MFRLGWHSRGWMALQPTKSTFLCFMDDDFEFHGRSLFMWKSHLFWNRSRETDSFLGVFGSVSIEMIVL